MSWIIFFPYLFLIYHLLVTKVTYGLIECDKDGLRYTVRGIWGNVDFEEQLYRCRDKDIILLSYEECDIGYINLPLSRILTIYPKLETLDWHCEGECSFSSIGQLVNVLGCNPKKSGN